MEIDKKSLADLHIAEYSAITERSTNFITIQFFLLGALATIIAIIFGNWNSANDFYCTWSFLSVIHISGIIYFVILLEQYRATLYIEKNLRQLLVDSGITEKFWQYEASLTTGRKGTGENKWELVWVPIIILFNIGFVYHRIRIWGLNDYLAGLFLLLCLITMVWRAILALKVKHELTDVTRINKRNKTSKKEKDL